jgi:phosphoesterase RecJ-like protein
MKKIPESVLTLLNQHQRFLLTSHLNPDGDAIGSEIGLARTLRRLGKTVLVWNHDAGPGIFDPMLAGEKLYLGRQPPASFPGDFDAVIVLECPELNRTGLEDVLPVLPLINIDHHLGNQKYGVVDWIDTDSPAVGEMVYRLARALDLPPDPATANALFLTLVTDTGGFRFSNTNARAFEAAAALVLDGASPEEVSGWLYESQPLASVLLIGEMLQTLEIHAQGRLATAWLTMDMLAKCGARPGDSEGLIDHPRSIAGVSAVALFKELPNGHYKVSLRSRGSIDVERVARLSGGGGHKNAAGFSSSAERDVLFADTRQALIESLDGT